MPITKERKKLYPKNWKEIRAKIMERANSRCELCGAPHMVKVYRPEHRPQLWTLTPHFHAVGKWVKIIITVHHINNDPADCRDYNLVACCQRCHLRLDVPFKHKAKKCRSTKSKS